jgi:hypothetical protein
VFFADGNGKNSKYRRVASGPISAMSAGTWKDSALTRPKAVSVIDAKKTAPFTLNDLQLYAAKRLALRRNFGRIKSGSLTPLFVRGGSSGVLGLKPQASKARRFTYNLLPQGVSLYPYL